MLIFWIRHLRFKQLGFTEINKKETNAETCAQSPANGMTKVWTSKNYSPSTKHHCRPLYQSKSYNKALRGTSAHALIHIQYIHTKSPEGISKMEIHLQFGHYCLLQALFLLSLLTEMQTSPQMCTLSFPFFHHTKTNIMFYVRVLLFKCVNGCW